MIHSSGCSVALWLSLVAATLFGNTTAFVFREHGLRSSLVPALNRAADNHLFSTALTSSAPDESVVVAQDVSKTQSLTKQQQRRDLIRQEGGPLSFNTKFGALNPFAIYYGLTSIVLGLPWFAALTMYQLFQVVTFGRFDKLRRIPIFLNQLWGESLMLLTRCYPVMECRDILKKFYKEYVFL